MGGVYSFEIAGVNKQRYGSDVLMNFWVVDRKHLLRNHNRFFAKKRVTGGRFGAISTDLSPGSLGFADPEAGVGYAYVTSQMGTRITGDPRDLALRDALYTAAQA